MSLGPLMALSLEASRSMAIMRGVLGGQEWAVRAAMEAEEERCRELARAAAGVVEAWQALPAELVCALLAEVPLEDDEDDEDELEDWEPYDLDPDGCWRCEAVDAENDLGTCNACLSDLRSDQ